MADTIRCPDCDERITLSRDDRDARIRCPRCRYVFDPEEERGRDFRSRGPSRPREEFVDDGIAPRRPGRLIAGIIAAAVFGMSLIGAGVYVAVAWKAPPEPVVARAADERPHEDPKPAGDHVALENRKPDIQPDNPDTTNEIPPPHVAIPKPRSNNTPPKTEVRTNVPPRRGTPKVLPPMTEPNPSDAIVKNQKPPKPVTDPDITGFAFAEWSVPVDPPPKGPEYPKKLEKIAITLPFGAEVCFPSSTSPFFAVGASAQTTDAFGLFDVRSKKPVGAVRGKTDLHAPMMLSPDGKYLAGHVADQFRLTPKVDLFEMATGQGVRRLEWDAGQIKWLDFGAGSETILVCTHDLTETNLEVWNIATGVKARSIKLPESNSLSLTIALSPGRHFAAVAAMGQVWVYNLGDGALCGSQPFPQNAGEGKHAGEFTCGGLAFSPDGKELAGLFKSSLQQNAEVCAWSLPSGKTAFEHDLSDCVSRDGFLPHTGDEIQYAPDGQAWLIQNNLVVERQTGTPLARLFGENTRQGAVRLLPNDMILTHDTNSRLVVSSSFMRAGYEAAAKAARAMSQTVTAPIDADRSGVKVVPGEVRPKWAVTADAAPTPVVKTKPHTSLPLVNPGSAVRVALFGSPDSNRAATLSVIDQSTPFIHRVLRWDSYDISTAKHLGGVKMGMIKEPKTIQILIDPKRKQLLELAAALSPSGGRLAVRNPADPRRIDIWSEDGKNLGAFLPGLAGGAVDWVAFSTDDKLITLADGRLTLWQVPSFKAIYELGAAYRGVPVLSSNRLWLAAYQESGFDILDVATGACRGRVQAVGNGKDLSPPIASFSADGSKLACIVPALKRQNIVVCEVATGTTSEPFSISAPLGFLQWTGPNHLMLGSELIDVEAKMDFWQYIGFRLPVQGAADRRFWFVRGDSDFNGGAGALASAILPDSTANQAMALLRKPKAQMLVGPGKPICIRMNASGPREDPDFAKRMTAQLTDNLEQQGFVVRDGAPLMVTVSGVVEHSGESYDLNPIGGRPIGGLRQPLVPIMPTLPGFPTPAPTVRPGRFPSGGGTRPPFGGVTPAPSHTNRSILIPKLTVTVAVTDSVGRNIWKDQQTFETKRMTRIFKAADDPDKTLEQEVWNMGSSLMANPSIPSRVYFVEGNLCVLPGKSILGAGR